MTNIISWRLWILLSLVAAVMILAANIWWEPVPLVPRGILV